MNKVTLRILVAGLSLGSLVVLNGCVASARSFASLASIASISASSSAVVAATNPDYQQDVTTATAIAMESGADGQEILRSVGKVAADYGVTDWESQEVTYQAIGKGMKIAGVDTRRANALARELAGGNQAAVGVLLHGYRS